MSEDIVTILRDTAQESSHQCPTCGTDSLLLSTAANKIELLRARGSSLSRVVYSAFYLNSVLERLAWRQVATNALDGWKEASSD